MGRAINNQIGAIIMHLQHGIIGLIILILDCWAIINTVTSSRSVMSKVMWTVLILILPVLGFIIWLFAGPRSGNNAA